MVTSLKLVEVEGIAPSSKRTAEEESPCSDRKLFNPANSHGQDFTRLAIKILTPVVMTATGEQPAECRHVGLAGVDRVTSPSIKQRWEEHRDRIRPGR